jgi:hypothetical protein
MLRAGFFLGFLVGAGVASLFSDNDRVETPGATTASGLLPEVDNSLKGTLRAAFREAKAAARQAADEKERELMWQFERSIRRQSDEPPPLRR